MTSPLGKKVVAPVQQKADPATVFTHVHGKVWCDGTGKMQTFDDGPPRPHAPHAFDSYEYDGCGFDTTGVL